MPLFRLWRQLSCASGDASAVSFDSDNDHVCHSCYGDRRATRYIDLVLYQHHRLQRERLLEWFAANKR